MTGVLTDTIQTFKTGGSETRHRSLYFDKAERKPPLIADPLRTDQFGPKSRKTRSLAPYVIRQMRDRLDIVAVRIENEGCIVVFVIMRPEAGSPIVFGACAPMRHRKRHARGCDPAP